MTFLVNSVVLNNRLDRVCRELDSLGFERNFLRNISVWNFVNENNYWLQQDDETPSCTVIQDPPAENYSSDLDVEIGTSSKPSSHDFTAYQKIDRPEFRDLPSPSSSSESKDTSTRTESHVRLFKVHLRPRRTASVPNSKRKRSRVPKEVNFDFNPRRNDRNYEEDGIDVLRAVGFNDTLMEKNGGGRERNAMEEEKEVEFVLSCLEKEDERKEENFSVSYEENNDVVGAKEKEDNTVASDWNGHEKVKDLALLSVSSTTFERGDPGKTNDTLLENRLTPEHVGSEEGSCDSNCGCSPRDSLENVDVDLENRSTKMKLETRSLLSTKNIDEDRNSLDENNSRMDTRKVKQVKESSSWNRRPSENFTSKESDFVQISKNSRMDTRKVKQVEESSSWNRRPSENFISKESDFVQISKNSRVDTRKVKQVEESSSWNKRPSENFTSKESDFVQISKNSRVDTRKVKQVEESSSWNRRPSENFISKESDFVQISKNSKMEHVLMQSSSDPGHFDVTSEENCCTDRKDLSVQDLMENKTDREHSDIRSQEGRTKLEDSSLGGSKFLGKEFLSTTVQTERTETSTKGTNVVSNGPRERRDSSTRYKESCRFRSRGTRVTLGPPCSQGTTKSRRNVEERDPECFTVRVTSNSTETFRRIDSVKTSFSSKAPKDRSCPATATTFKERVWKNSIVSNAFCSSFPKSSLDRLKRAVRKHLSKLLSQSPPKKSRTSFTSSNDCKIFDGTRRKENRLGRTTGHVESSCSCRSISSNDSMVSSSSRETEEEKEGVSGRRIKRHDPRMPVDTENLENIRSLDVEAPDRVFHSRNSEETYDGSTECTGNDCFKKSNVSKAKDDETRTFHLSKRRTIEVLPSTESIVFLHHQSQRKNEDFSSNTWNFTNEDKPYNKAIHDKDFWQKKYEDLKENCRPLEEEFCLSSEDCFLKRFWKEDRLDDFEDWNVWRRIESDGVYGVWEKSIGDLAFDFRLKLSEYVALCRRVKDSLRQELLKKTR